MTVLSTQIRQPEHRIRLPAPLSVPAALLIGCAADPGLLVTALLLGAAGGGGGCQLGANVVVGEAADLRIRTPVARTAQRLRCVANGEWCRAGCHFIPTPAQRRWDACCSAGRLGAERVVA